MTKQVRLALIRRRVNIAPPGGKAEAADRARRMMRAADESLPHLTAPPAISLDFFERAADAAPAWPPPAR